MFCSMKISKTAGSTPLRESVNPRIRAVIGQQDLDREYRRSSKLKRWRACELSPYSQPILRASGVNSWGISSSLTPNHRATSKALLNTAILLRSRFRRTSTWSTAILPAWYVLIILVRPTFEAEFEGGCGIVKYKSITFLVRPIHSQEYLGENGEKLILCYIYQVRERKMQE